MDETQLRTFERGVTSYYDIVGKVGLPTVDTRREDGTRQMIYKHFQSRDVPFNGFIVSTSTVTIELDARERFSSYTLVNEQARQRGGLQSLIPQ